MSAGSDKDKGSSALTPRDAAVANAQHTPGPWTVEYYGEVGSDSLVIHSDADKRVCFLATPGHDYERPHIAANARLIAAAPELLEAAKTVLAGLLERFEQAPAHAKPVFKGIASLHGAIAKATQPPAKAGEAKQ